MGALRINNDFLRLVPEKKGIAEKKRLSSYRFGFNGQEKDDEWDGVTGSKLDFGARIYDSRTARFLSLDPKMREYSFMSPYCFAANNPIRFVDVLGLGPGDAAKGELSSKDCDDCDKTYTKTSSKEGMTSVLAPNGKYYNFSNKEMYFTYSDGKEHNEQVKAKGVWSVTNANGTWMWNNKDGKFFKNTSDKGGGENSFPITGAMGTTYAGEFNPRVKIMPNVDDYSQPPQNIADYYGYQHDKEFDALGISGSDGTNSDLSTPANIRLINNMDVVIQMYENQTIDVYTGAPVSEQTYQIALAMKIAFEYVEQKKAVKKKVKSWF